MASGLGVALGLAISNTWAQIVAKIKAVVNRGALDWSASNTTYSVPAGYYSSGTLDSRPSYNNGYNDGVTAADNRANANSVNYKTGYNAGVAAGEISIGNAKALFAYTASSAQTVSLTCPSCKAAVGIAIGYSSHSASSSFAPTVSTTSPYTPNYTKNETMEKNMFVRLNPGNTVSVYTGASASNTRITGAVVIVYI